MKKLLAIVLSLAVSLLPLRHVLVVGAQDIMASMAAGYEQGYSLLHACGTCMVWPLLAMIPELILAWIVGFVLHELAHLGGYLACCAVRHRWPSVSVHLRFLLLRIGAKGVSLRSRVSLKGPYCWPHESLPKRECLVIALAPLAFGVVACFWCPYSAFWAMVGLTVVAGSTGDLLDTWELVKIPGAIRATRRRNFSLKPGSLL